MHSFTHYHTRPDAQPAPSRRGATITLSAWRYDLIVRWFVMHGKEQVFRGKIADLARLQSGEAVLDVGCGTGTQALVAKERVGTTGRVCGIDPSVSLLAGARRKAARAGLAIDFQVGGIERIAFADQSFDVVLSTFMFHHVPDDLKRQGLSEVARVLKPDGRLLVVDFKHTEEPQKQPGQFGAGELGLQELPALMKEAGFAQVESGEISFHIRSLDAGHKQYDYTLARKSTAEARRSADFVRHVL
ncbi:MAG: class I SAM-dependent methyltransferase [Ktedonobacterales bacterium]